MTGKTTSESKTALIVGAGIAGLTVSLALLRLGMKVKLYEAAPSLSEIGAGISIGPNASRVFTKLGLNDQLIKYASQPGIGVIRHFATGEEILSVSRDDHSSKQNGSSSFLQLHRADLVTVLLSTALKHECFSLHTNHSLKAVSQDNETVLASFENGIDVEGDFLVGCDGLRSVVRRQLFGPDKPRFTGQVAYRCLIPSPVLPKNFSSKSTAVYIGPNQILNLYFVRQDTLLNCVGIAASDSWTHEGWTTPASTEEFIDRYQGWNSDLLKMISRAPKDSIFKWALFDREPIYEWGIGRITLAGDAAHPMLPFLGLGAAMGIEDACILGRAFEEFPEPIEALQSYQAARVERCASVLLDSRLQGSLYQEADPELYGRDGRPHELRLKYYSFDPVGTSIEGMH